MPTKKICDLDRERGCRHPEHNPPSLQVYSNGVWEHTCPACGTKQLFVVNKPEHAVPVETRYQDDDPLTDILHRVLGEQTGKLRVSDAYLICGIACRPAANYLDR